MFPEENDLHFQRWQGIVTYLSFLASFIGTLGKAGPLILGPDGWELNPNWAEGGWWSNNKKQWYAAGYNDDQLWRFKMELEKYAKSHIFGDNKALLGPLTDPVIQQIQENLNPEHLKMFHVLFFN